jgi:hypothetical protein
VVEVKIIKKTLFYTMPPHRVAAIYKTKKVSQSVTKKGGI